MKIFWNFKYIQHFFTCIYISNEINIIFDKACRSSLIIIAEIAKITMPIPMVATVAAVFFIDIPPR